eukprot:gene11799-2178_t
MEWEENDGKENENDRGAIILEKLMRKLRKLEDWELNDLDEESDDSTESESERERVGNADWCVCGSKCKAIETYAKSLWSQETNDNPENHFQGGKEIFTKAEAILGEVKNPLGEGH